MFWGIFSGFSGFSGLFWDSIRSKWIKWIEFISCSASIEIKEEGKGKIRWLLNLKFNCQLESMEVVLLLLFFLGRLGRLGRPGRLSFGWSIGFDWRKLLSSFTFPLFFIYLFFYFAFTISTSVGQWNSWWSPGGSDDRLLLLFWWDDWIQLPLIPSKLTSNQSIFLKKLS